MAKRRKKTSSGPRRKTSSRRKGSRRRKGFLSEAFTPATAMQSARGTFSGLLGGGISYGLNRIIPGESPLVHGLANLGSAFLASAVMKAPSLGAGIAGAYGYQLAERLAGKAMSEDADYADEDSLSEYPDALDEDGTPMFLAEDGNFYYLEEFELAESFQDEQMYPRYVNSAQY